MTRYKPIRTDHWGKELDYNVFPDRASLEAAQANGTDKNSVYGDPMFIDPQSGDFRVAEGSPALRVGFKNFSMDDFGVVSPELKQIAKRVTIPRLMKSEKIVEEKVLEYKGIKLKNLSSLGEQSATGMDKINNVLVMDVNPESEFAEYFEPNDVILSIDQKPINKLEDFMIVSKSVTSSVEVIIFRNQVQQTFEIKF
jgi:S1-C subfamily serine protease